MTQFKDLQCVSLNSDNLVAFMNDWDDCIYGMRSVPNEDILENLFDAQIRKCSHFHSTYSLYEMQTTHGGDKKTYEKLRTMVLTHIALRQQNKITAQAQNTQNRSAAAAPGGPRKGDCHKWMKTGNCAADCA